MADAEKKDIARLDFKIDDAKSKLNEINTLLENLATKSESYANRIGTSLNGAIDVSKMINTEQVQQKFTTITGYTTQFGQKMKYTLSGQVDFSKMIDVSKFKKDLDSLESLGKSGAKKWATTIVTEETKVAANRTKLREQVAAKEKETNLDMIKSEQKKADQIEVIDAQRVKNAEATENSIKKIVEKGEQDRQTAAYKSALKQEEYNKRVEKSTKTLYDKITDYAKTYLIYQGFNKLRQTMSEVIDEMVDLESQMVQIDRVLNESTLNLDSYRDKLLNLAYEYGNSMSNVTDITLRLAQAGFSSSEALALTEKTLLALNTAELDATQATDDMVAVMAQWGLMTGTATEQAKQYGDIIDKINIVADNYPTTSADIMDALKKVSSAFNLAGASVDETIATITAAEIASQRGGKAIGTALSNITQQLKDTNRLNIAESLGLDFYTDSTKQEFKDIIEIFQEMSDKMQELKDAGKENSTEMQNLLSIFTVFRRNVGASLLSEMGGEVSKYDEIMQTLTESTNYSLQENEKYLKTVKAQQEQFNATLLKLKTEVWDNGVEDVYKGMLSLGTDLVKNTQSVIKIFGAVPTAVGLAVAALTLLNKQMRLYRTVSVTMSDGTTTNIKMLNDWVLKLQAAATEVKTLDNGQRQIVTSISAFIRNLKGLATAEGQAAAEAVILEAKTIALQAAYTLGLSLAITAIISGFDNLVHAEEKQIEKYNEIIEKSAEAVEKLEQENEEIEDLITNYEKLQDVNNSQDEVLKTQENITNYLIKQNQYTKEMINDYDLQLKKLKEIQKANRENSLNEAKNALKTAQELNKGKSWFGSRFEDVFGFDEYKLYKAGVDYSKLEEVSGESLEGKSNAVFSTLAQLDLDKQLEVLKDFEEQLKTTGQYGSEAWTLVEEKISEVEGSVTQLTEAQKEYNNQLLENTLEDVIEPDSITNIEDYTKALESINDIEPTSDWTGTVDNFRASLTALLQNEFPEFKEQTTENLEVVNNSATYMEELSTKLETLQTKYTALTTAQNELNSSGQLTVSTFKNLVDNDLINYLDVVNGKLVIGETALLNEANATKQAVIAKLQDEAATNILAIVEDDLRDASEDVEEQQAETATSTTNDTNAKLANMKVALANAISVQGLAEAYENERKAQEGAEAGQIDWGALSEKATQDIQKEINRVNTLTATINKLKLTAATASNTTGSTNTTDDTASAAQKAEEEAAKAAEEAYKARLEAFEDYVDEKERLEKRWIDKQKELGQLSNEDFLYITQQRIERYKKYLEEVKNATWLSEEDRLSLMQEYSEKIEDLQVDYLGYLQDQLDDEIEAIEDANEEKIKLIEEEAEAKINALKKVEDARDRDRDKEDYEKERQSILDEIAYWEQRTGREAQEALKEAKESLEELDAEWEDQLEDWSIEDQIQAIEDERDAQISAIEDAQEAEIASIKAVYDAKVKLFAETGEIIYENSVMQSQALYNAYKTNFIDPISSELTKLNEASTATAPAATTTETTQQYENYTIQSGDTLSKIAKKYGTTVDKIMAANPYITNKNKIYAGKTLQIPKFHEGGIVGGTQEAFALLKPNEVVLKPSWAASLDRMMKHFDNVSAGTTNISNGSNIEVNGDLIKIEANVRSQSDIDLMTKKIEKVLKDKFNIKK